MEELLEAIAALPPLLGYGVLGLAALIEYVIPPFPGDTITLLGAVMIASVGWSMPWVLAFVTAGSVGGAWIDYEVGVWLARTKRRTWLHRRLTSASVGPKVDRLCAGFARHGAAYIALNRFLPGVRAFFFVVAGMSGVSRSRALFFAGVSALAWNVLILMVGYAIGFELPRLIAWVQGYTQIVYGVLLVLTAIWGGRWLWRRGRRGRGAGISSDKNLSESSAGAITGEPREAEPARSGRPN